MLPLVTIVSDESVGFQLLSARLYRVGKRRNILR